jgi:hypothetical protein
MSPIGDRHGACVSRLIAMFSQHFGDRAIVDAQDPIVVSDTYALEPDLRCRVRGLTSTPHTPSAADCLLVVQVADTSAESDGQIKVPRDARGGRAELWVVDLEREVVVYQDPSGDANQHVRLFHRGDTVKLGTLQGPEVSVAAALLD